MAHITLKLIWYRLGETFDKMAAASENITGWLDWDDHLLDFLLIGWIGWAAVVVVVVNSVLTFFGPLQPRGDFVVRTKEGATGAKVVAGTGGAESCQWLNSALNWFYLHYEKFPEFVDVWVKALNEQSVKLGGPVQVKFERVKSGSLPPKFSEVTFEAGPEGKYVVTCKTDSRDVSLAVFASQQTAEGVKLTNLTTNILKLKGTLKMKCFREGSDMMVNVSFEGRPDVKVVGKPVNPYQDPNDLVDVGVVETVVRNAICLTSSNFNISKLLLGGSYGNLSPRVMGTDPPLSPANLSPRTEAVFEPIEVKEVQQSAFHAPTLASAPRSSRPAPGEKRLLVKVIKASALGSRDVGSVDPTCVVTLDNPPQTQATSVVKSTVNPFWDEQFLFDVSGNSREVKFEVRDRRRPATENFLGEAYVYYDDLKRTPSSRQIIPLQGNPDIRGDMVSGSLTVEFLFVDPLEAEAIRQTIAAMSPKRTVEVNQAKTPGGTLVTKTTTTTERSRHGRQGAEVDGSPNYIEKHTNLYDYDGSDSHSLSTNPQDRSVSSSSDRKSYGQASDKPSDEKPPTPVTSAQEDSVAVEETTISSDAVSSDAVVEQFQENSSLTSQTVPLSECGFKPTKAEQADSLDFSFPKFVPIGMHPPAEVKTFPDKKKSPTPKFESEYKIKEMQPSPIPTVDLLDENVVFEISYALGEAELTEAQIDTTLDTLSENVKQKPDTEVKSGFDTLAETAQALEKDIGVDVSFEEVPVPQSDEDIEKDMSSEVAQASQSDEDLTKDMYFEEISVPQSEDIKKDVSSEIAQTSQSDEDLTKDMSFEEISVPQSEDIEKDVSSEVTRIPQSDGDLVKDVSFEEISIPQSEDIEKDVSSEVIRVPQSDGDLVKDVSFEEISVQQSEDIEKDVSSEVTQIPQSDGDLVKDVSFQENSVPQYEDIEKDVSSEVAPILQYDKDVNEDMCSEATKTFQSNEDIQKDSFSEVTPSTLPDTIEHDVSTAETKQETCQGVVVDSTNVEDLTHSRSASPFADDSSCSSFHDEEYISHSSTEDLTEDAATHYFTYNKVDVVPGENCDLSIDTSCVKSEDVPKESPHQESTVEKAEEAQPAIEEQAAVASQVFKCDPKQSEDFHDELEPKPEAVKDVEPLEEANIEPEEHAAVTTKVFTPEPGDHLELSPEPEPIAVIDQSQHSAVTSEIDLDYVVSSKSEQEEQSDPTLPDKVQCSTSEDTVLAQVEPSKQFVSEETADTCLMMPSERVLAAQKLSPTDTILSSSMPEETTLSASENEIIQSPEKSVLEIAENDIIASKVEPTEQTVSEETTIPCRAMPPERVLAPQEVPSVEAVLSSAMPVETTLSADETEIQERCISEPTDVDPDVIVTKVEASEEMCHEETTSSCSSFPTERLLATQTVTALESVVSETMPRETKLPAGDLVAQVASEGDIALSEVEKSEQIAHEETMESCPAMPAERLLAAQNIPTAEVVLSETMPAETVLLVDDSASSATVPCGGDETAVARIGEPAIVFTSEEKETSIEESADNKAVSPERNVADVSTEDKQLSTEQEYIGEDDLSDYDDLPENIPSEFMLEDMTEELEIETEKLAKFPVLIDESEDATLEITADIPAMVQQSTDEEKTITEPVNQTAVTETALNVTCSSSSHLVTDQFSKDVRSDLKHITSEIAGESLPDKTMKLDLVPSPLLQEMEQIASDMSSLAEDISKSPVLAAEESPEITEYDKTESSNADDTSLSVSCHSADVFVVRDSEYEMSDDNTSPVESSTNNQDMDVIAISPDEATLKLIEAQATEATALDFSSTAREKLASISSVSEIIQDLPAHSTRSEQELLESSTVSVDVTAESDPIQDEFSAVDDLLHEVTKYSKSQEGKSSLATEDVVFTGQFISDPVDEAELAREISLADISSQSTEGLKVNVFVTANTESSEPSSPLAKYDVVEDLSVSVGEPSTEECLVLPSDVETVNTAISTDASLIFEDVPSTEASLEIKVDDESLETKPEFSVLPEKLSSEEITLPLPTAEEEKTTEESFQAQSETQDDSPTMRALHRRQKYLAEQAKKKELFVGSGHTEDNDAVKSYKTSIEISQKNVLPKIPDESYIKESKPKMSNSAAFEEIKPRVQPFDSMPKTMVVQVESTEITGPPKELVSDLMSGQKIPSSPDRYASLTRPLRVYKQVSSDIEDDTSKANKKRVDDWVTATTDDLIVTTGTSTDQTPLSLSESVSQQTPKDVQVSPPLLENVQSVNKPGFVIRPQTTEKPPSEVVSNVQRPGFAISRHTVEPAVNIVPQPPANIQVVQRPGFAISRQNFEPAVAIEPQPPANIQVVQRPGFAISRQIVEPAVNIEPQPPANVLCPADNLPQTPQPQSDHVQPEPESVVNPQPSVEDAQLSPESLPEVESAPVPGRVYRPRKDYNTLPRPSKSYKDVSTPKRAGSLPRSSSSADRQHQEPVKSIPTIKTTQSSPTDEASTDIPTVRMDPPPTGHDEKEKKKGSSLARTIKKRFSRSKKRSKSAERSRDDSHLQPPDQSYGQAQSKDDIELVRAQPDTPSLKKSRSLGGSLKKLFRRGRKRSRDRGETSRESSYSRSSTRNASQGPSREGSITRGTSSSLTRSGQLPDQKGEIGRSHWSKSNTTSNEYLERGIDVSPRHQQMDTTYPVLQQEPAVIQPRGMSSHEADVGRGHWSRPKSGEQLDVARHSYDTHSAPPETEDVRRGHWSKSKSPPRSGTVVITTPKKEPLDVVTPSYDTMAAPPEDKMEVRRSHWSKSKSPGRSVGGVVITKPKHEVPDVVSSSSAKVTAPEVKEEIKEVEVKSQSMEKIDNVDSTEDNVSPPELSDDVRKGHWSKSKTPVHYGPVIIKKRESMEIDVSDKTETTTDASSVQPEVRRGHWSKSKSPSRERDRIGQIVVSNAPVTAAPHAEVDIRKGHWTKSKSRSPKRESFPTVSPGTSVPDNQPSSPVSQVESQPSPVKESSDNVKMKAKSTRVEHVKSKPVKVVPIKAKPSKAESALEEPEPMISEEPIVPPPPSAKKGHWSKTATDSSQPSGGGVVVVTTDIAEVPVIPAEPVDVRRGHWTKPKTSAS